MYDVVTSLSPILEIQYVGSLTVARMGDRISTVTSRVSQLYVYMKCFYAYVLLLVKNSQGTSSRIHVSALCGSKTIYAVNGTYSTPCMEVSRGLYDVVRGEES